MWGVRNLALAAGLAGLHGPDRRRWWQLNVAIDVVDATASALAWRRKELGTPAAALVTSVALAAVALGASSVAGEADDPRVSPSVAGEADELPT